MAPRTLKSKAFRIDCIIPYSRGLILGCEKGKIYAYERTPAENVVYKLQQKRISSKYRDQPRKIEIKKAAIT